MPIRYKFRSSVDFDSFDPRGGAGAGVRVRELRAEVLRRKGLPLSDDFELLVSDANTGQAFEDEDFEIPDGSSVIIKRVPFGRVETKYQDVKQADVVKVKASSPTKNVSMEKFDDFGTDLYPVPEAPSSSDSDVGNTILTAHRKDDIVPRDHCISILKVFNMDLPMELRCSLCDTIFKEAVMIPCCQHSFCNQCIHSALVERESCPMCGSTKCKVEDLLPNLSLRQAIEHFLEAQVATNGADNISAKIVPDGESGIQVKDVSCAMSIHQKEPEFPHSPSATGKGSNLVTSEPAFAVKRNPAHSPVICLPANKLHMSDSTPLLKIKQAKAGGNSAVGGSQQLAEPTTLMPRKHPQKEGVISSKRKGLSLHPSDRSGLPVPTNKHRKGDKTCFMCGSPHHLLRDCPAAIPYQMQRGDISFLGALPAYDQSYWQGPSFPHMRPYTTFYGAPGMMPFNQTLNPVGAFGINSYFPSFCSGVSMPYGFMRMGGLPHATMAGAQHPVIPEFLDLYQDGDRKQKNLDTPKERDIDYATLSEDSHHKQAPRVLREPKYGSGKEISRSYSSSDDPQLEKNFRDKQYYSSSRQKPELTSDEEFHAVDLKHARSHLLVSGRDTRTHYSEKSVVQDDSCSSIHDNRDRKKHRCHRTSSSKKHRERKRHSGSDRSRSHQRNSLGISDNDEKIAPFYKKHSTRQTSKADSDLEHDFSSEKKQLLGGKDSSNAFRISSNKLEAATEPLVDDRWEMVDCSDDEYRREYHYHKRKRRR